MAEDKLTIKCGTTPNVLMIGNGFNRAFNFASWDDLIKSVGTKVLSENDKKNTEKLPKPLQPVVLTDNRIGIRMEKVAPNLTELRAPKEEENLLRKFAELPVQAILTGNYTYELEKALIPDFRCKVSRACKFRKKTDIKAGKYEMKMLHMYFDADELSSTIWHFHGEAAKPDTMVLGHYYYGKLLAKMQQYISQMLRNANGCFSKGKDYTCRSWIDYFMLGNVYIIGLGMDLSELDLWWLVNCKKRHYPDTKVTLFKPDISPEQKLLADAYDIAVDTDILLKGNDYLTYYEEVYRKLNIEYNGKARIFDLCV